MICSTRSPSYDQIICIYFNRERYQQRNSNSFHYVELWCDTQPLHHPLLCKLQHLRQLPYFTSEPCQHWGNRNGKTHHSTMILKYQNIFHLVKIISLLNKTNENIVKYARFWGILLLKKTLGEPQIHPAIA